MLKGYSKFLDALEKVEKAILAITVAIMIIIITYQVIMRYVFANANSWSEELARYLFIYDVMIGAADTRITGHTRDGRDVAIFDGGEWVL